MKLAACYVVYDDTEYLDMSINSIYDVSDVIFLLLNTKPWNGKERPDDRSKAKSEIERIIANKPKCILVEGTWDREHEQRNAGLDLAKQHGCEFSIIIDTDEAYSISEAMNFRGLMEQNPYAPSFHSAQNTYWKKDPIYRIEPREPFNPLIAVNVNQYRFYDKRQGITCDKYGVPNSQYAYAFIPPHLVIMHHFSYARDDLYVKNKLMNFEHSHEILPNWYENTWMQFKPGNKKLHPVTAAQYMHAVEVDYNQLPKNIADYLRDKK